jgi:hypothetical protein
VLQARVAWRVRRAFQRWWRYFGGHRPPRDSFEIGIVSQISAGEAGVYELVQQLLITDAMGDRIDPLMPADQVRGRRWSDSNGLLKPSH